MSVDAKKIAALELALKAKTEQLSALHKQMDAAREAIASLESERAANAILTAEIAGLQASAGHLGALVDMQRSILVDVERVLGSDSFGLPLEDGDSKIMDRVRSMLAATTEQQRQGCEPLSDEQIEELFEDGLGFEPKKTIVREIERAHGIGGQS